MKNYKQLTLDQRYQIQALLKAEIGKNEIAKETPPNAARHQVIMWQ